MKSKHVSKLLIGLVLVVFVGGWVQQSTIGRCDYQPNPNESTQTISATPTKVTSPTSEGTNQ